MEKKSRGGHITVNGIRLTDLQKFKKTKQTDPDIKKERKNNKATPSAIQKKGGILKFVQRSKKGEMDTSRMADAILERGMNAAPAPQK